MASFRQLRIRSTMVHGASSSIVWLRKPLSSPSSPFAGNASGVPRLGARVVAVDPDGASEGRRGERESVLRFDCRLSPSTCSLLMFPLVLASYCAFLAALRGLMRSANGEGVARRLGVAVAGWGSMGGRSRQS